MKRLINGSKNVALFLFLVLAIPLISVRLGIGKIINSILKDKSKNLSDLNIKRFGIKDANADTPASCGDCGTSSCASCNSCAVGSCESATSCH